MGKAPRPYRPRKAESDDAGRGAGDTRPPRSSRRDLAIGGDGRFLPDYPRPSVGDRYGELTVVGVETGPLGGLRAVVVQCSCGKSPHSVAASSLRKGATTRCPACAQRAIGRKRKEWFKYAEVCPDDMHRRRLCNRISASVNRCHNPRDRAYPNYGGRGISVHPPWREDRSLYLAHLVSLEGWDDPSLEVDRIDVDRGYEPGNIRFVTKRANRNNQRKIRDMQAEIDRLRECLRHCKCGAAQSLYDYF